MALMGELFRVLLKYYQDEELDVERCNHEPVVRLCDKHCRQDRILMRSRCQSVITLGWDRLAALSFLPVYSGKHQLALLVISPLLNNG